MGSSVFRLFVVVQSGLSANPFVILETEVDVTVSRRMMPTDRNVTVPVFFNLISGHQLVQFTSPEYEAVNPGTGVGVSVAVGVGGGV